MCTYRMPHRLYTVVLVGYGVYVSVYPFGVYVSVYPSGVYTPFTRPARPYCSCSALLLLLGPTPVFPGLDGTEKRLVSWKRKRKRKQETL